MVDLMVDLSKVFCPFIKNGHSYKNLLFSQFQDFSGDACGEANQTYHTKIIFKCDHKVSL